MHILCQINLIDFGASRMYSFFYRNTKNNSYIIWPVESNILCECLNDAFYWAQVYIISHHPTYFIDFGEFRINIFFIGVQKRILTHYSL